MKYLLMLLLTKSKKGKNKLRAREPESIVNVLKDVRKMVAYKIYGREFMAGTPRQLKTSCRLLKLIGSYMDQVEARSMNGVVDTECTSTVAIISLKLWLTTRVPLVMLRKHYMCFAPEVYKMNDEIKITLITLILSRIGNNSFTD